MPDTLLLLQNNRLFKGVSSEDLENIAPILERKYYPRGARICEEGEINSKFYIILSGQVRVLRRDEQGEEVELDILTQGAFFGELPLLVSEPRLTTIEVVIDAEVFEVDKMTFEKAIRYNTTVLYNLGELLSTKFHIEQDNTKKKKRVKYPIICVYGTEETIGKSMVAINLGVSLIQQTKCRVIVLDMGMKDQGVASMLKIDPVRYVDTPNIDQSYIEEKIITHQTMLDIISVAPDLLKEETKGRESIAKILGILKNLYDYIIIDTSSQLYRSTFEAIDLSNMMLFVTSNMAQEEYPLIMLDHQKVRMVLNLTDEAIDKVLIREKGYHFLPRSYAVIEQFLETGVPFVESNPMGELSQAFGRIARDIGGKKIGLALGGGSARGMAHIGVFYALENHGIPIDIIAGSSAGALIGSAYAAGVSIHTIEEAVLKWGSKLGLLRLTIPDMLDLKYYTKALGRVFKRNKTIWDPRLFRFGIGMFSGVEVNKLYLNVVGDPDFSDMQIPLAVVALDVNTGEKVVYEKGKVRLAVRASLSIPGIFTPLAYDGRLLIDGSIVDPVPVTSLVERGADIIIAVNVTPSLQDSLKSLKSSKRQDQLAISRSPLLPVFDIAMRSLQSLQYELSTIKTTQASVHIIPDVGDVSWSEFFNADKLIQKGQEATEEMIPQIQHLRWEM